MAFIGMKYVVAAPIDTETAGSAVTYGTGFVVGKAISGNLTWDRNDNPLYADDAIAENDNSVLGGNLEIGVDDLADTVRNKLLGEKEVTVTSGNTSSTEYETTDAAAPYVGVGFIRVRRKAGATTYQAVWFHKVQFSEESEEAATKGESIEWQTPTINGKIMSVQNDETLANNFRRRATFDTEAAAKAWLNAKAGISA